MELAIGLFVGGLIGLLVGTHLGYQLTRPEVVKEAKQRAFEHTIGHPGDIP